ncbi:NAD(P)-dependent oxidoreductase [Caldovatus aquaticus]|uniref:3-phosphoglycerate dehydrogenase n=1 Tax=Caldovatus aquaticus TaxID=2865671 RepID=A0ABS7F111_9PROT|nr:NAD(P)-dependent oxidoreductase [Caldovatus aquaticus]MBW8269198.1 3-phosphoglycerate dehydrogenase [Caldovatus aquaticus]
MQDSRAGGAPARLRIGYLGRPPHPSFFEAARAHPELELVEIAPSESGEAMRAQLRSCHAYYVRASRQELPRPMHVTAEFLAAVPNLLAAVSSGAGFDPIDVAACTDAGVAVVNQAGANAQGVAEHAVGMMLALLKRMPETAAAMRAGRAEDRAAFMGREIAGRTVGLVGIGHVGTRVAAILRAAFGCRVLAADPYLDAATVAARGAEKVELPTLLAESDVVSLHCPYDATTRGMFGAAAFAAMRRGAVFVTTARGGIHDEAALLEALESGHLAGAGLDVWVDEPPPTDHPLLAHPRVIATQHTAGVTEESRRRIARYAVEAFAEIAAGRLPPRLQNPQALERYRARWAEAFGRAPAF